MFAILSMYVAFALAGIFTHDGQYGHAVFMFGNGLSALGLAIVEFIRKDARERAGISG